MMRSLRRTIMNPTLWLAGVCLGTSVASWALEFKDVPVDLQRSLRRDLPGVFQSSVEFGVMDQALKRLFSSGQFESLQLVRTAGGGWLIQGKPIRKIKDIEVVGNDLLSKSEILAILELSLDTQYESSRITESAERLKARYGELGYLNARVEISSREDDQAGIQLAIKVLEGEPCRLDAIRVLTNNAELKKAVERITRSYLRKPIEKDTVTNLVQDVRNYFVDNRYLIAGVTTPELTIDPEKTTATLNLAIERPFKFVLLIDGNQHFSTMEILRKIAVSTDNPTGANPAAELAGRIRSLYLAAGFADAKVDFREQVLATEFNRLVQFKIEEGPRVRIRSLRIEGTLSRRQEWYLDFLEDVSTSVKVYGYYNRLDLDQALEKLVFELQNQGFLRAKVRSTRIEYSKRRDFVNVQILLDEGPQTIIQDVIFKGNTQFTTAELLGAVELNPKRPLSLKTVEASLSKLENHYQERGYLDMKITNPLSDLVKYSEDNLNAVITYEIAEGPKVRVGAIVVEGNEKTRDQVILTELEFKPGQVLTPEAINDSVIRLQRTELFSEVSISTLEKDTPVAERTVIVRVSERFPGQFKSGIGLNTEFDLTARGYLGVGYRNLAGTARGLSGRLELNRVTDIDFMDHRLTASYLEPYLFESRTRGVINLTRSYSIKKRDRTLDQVIATDTNEFELLLVRELTKNIKLTWNLWSVASIIDFEIDDKVASESQVIATVGPTVEFEFRDDPFNPTTGSYARFNSEYSTPYLGSSNKITYTRSNAVFTHYLPIGSRRFVWANSVRGGYVKNLDPESGIPDSKLFFLGGRSTIRGFDTGAIPPRGGTVRPLNGESHFYLFKTELRFPIAGDLGGVLFYDGGAVTIVDNETSTASKTESAFRSQYPLYRDSVGIGLRYNTPVGPVSAEYGYKLNRQTQQGESEGRFHFSIGTF